MTRPLSTSFVPHVEIYADDVDRKFHFVHMHHAGAHGLAIHFSAFFGGWENAKSNRHIYGNPREITRHGGYFHRLKMLGTVPTWNWFFVCDEYGADRNGTYYMGERGDLFVERAIQSIIQTVVNREQVTSSDIVCIGSSMGAAGALKFGLIENCRGIITVAPHVDLDVCAIKQSRMRHVQAIVPDGDAIGEQNYYITRQIRRLVSTRPADSLLPRLFMQACMDDDGVYDDQVLSLAKLWRDHGGWCEVDARPVGGHTSDYATREMFIDLLDRIRSGEPAPLDLYQNDPTMRGGLIRPSFGLRLKSFLARTRNRIMRRLHYRNGEKLIHGA